MANGGLDGRQPIAGPSKRASGHIYIYISEGWSRVGLITSVLVFYPKQDLHGSSNDRPAKNQGR